MTFLWAIRFFCLMSIKPMISKMAVTPLSVAFTLGKPDTFKAPSNPSGLGPKIKKAIAAEITTETI
jgi:hypothetical protein